MKKLLTLLVSILIAIALVACNNSNDENKPSDKDNEDSKTEEQVYEIGDTAEIDGVNITLTNVTSTNKRSEFAESNPSKVVKIEYEVQNNSDEEITVGMDLEVYDRTDTKADSYPLDNTIDSLAPGKKLQAVSHYGIEESPIEIHFSPLLSFDDETIIFKADID